jgi:class 3 adenylate cyclase
VKSAITHEGREDSVNLSVEVPEAASARQNQLIIVLADISGYTELMVASQTAAMHGQIVVSMLIESILKEVEIPLQLQEIEGDAVFLYAEHPGSEALWQEVCEHVGSRLPRFFEAFAEATVAADESALCRCAICRNKELRLKVVVHSGEAVFHSIRGRAQVSGVDVIQAHRLLKNSIPSNEYILLTDTAHEHIGEVLNLELTEGEETYEGLGSIRTFVHFLGDQEDVRRTFYAQSPGQLARAGVRYSAWLIVEEFKALFQNRQFPIAPISTPRRLAFVASIVLISPLVFLTLAATTPIRLILRRARHR